MAYLRKRAAVACNYCRHRKRRCDAKTPMCSLCAESGVSCEYPEVPRDPTSDNTTQLLLSRLNVLETQMKQQSDLIAALQEQQSITPRQSSTIESSFPGQSPNLHEGLSPSSRSIVNARSEAMGMVTSISPSTVTHVNQTPDPNGNSIHTNADDHDCHDLSLTIPIGHWTTTGSLLQLPQIKSFLGDYPENTLLQLESSRSTPLDEYVLREVFHDQLELDAELTESYVDAFFTYVHPLFPVLDREILLPLFHTVLEGGVRTDAASALCLVVFALGKMAINGMTCSSLEEQEDMQGLEYFASAHRIATTAWGICHETDHILPLALIHNALYLQYMNLPLQAWRMVHLTCINLQSSVASSKPGRANDVTSAPFARLYWACFIIESDTLAEFHIPGTGIERLVDKMHFPSFSMYADRNALLFLAMCSIRRLLNRVHSTLYAKGERTAPPTSPGISESSFTSACIVTATNLESVCAELVRQLKTWYESLPEEIKPALDDTTPCDLLDGWLRLRYWSAMHIIGRPFLIFVVSSPNRIDFPPQVMEYCKLCIGSCRSIILMASHILEHRTQFTWMIIHALLACTFMVSLASTSPALKPLVPDAAQLLSQVATALKPWSSSDSSAEMIAWFVQLIRQKLRLSAID